MSDENILTQEVENDEEPGLVAYMFTNDRGAAWRLQPLLNMFYQGAFNNTIGISEMLNVETDKVELVLVGVEHDPDTRSTKTYPLARVLSPEDLDNYMEPDGKGDWLEWGGDDEEEEVNVH